VGPNRRFPRFSSARSSALAPRLPLFPFRRREGQMVGIRWSPFRCRIGAAMAMKQKRTDVSAVAADAEKPDDSAPMRQVHMLFGFKDPAADAKTAAVRHAHVRRRCSRHALAISRTGEESPSSNLWSVIPSVSGCKPGSLLGALVIQSNTHCCRQLTELLLHFSEATS